MTPNEMKKVIRIKADAENMIRDLKESGLFETLGALKLESTPLFAALEGFKPPRDLEDAINRFGVGAWKAQMAEMVGDATSLGLGEALGLSSLKPEMMKKALGLSSMVNAAEIEKLLAPIDVKELERELGLDPESEARRSAQLEALTSAMISAADRCFDPSLFRRSDNAAHRKPRLRRQSGFSRGEALPKVLDKGWNPGPIGF